MKKFLLIMFFILFSFFVLNNNSVEAYSNNVIYSLDEVRDCEGMFGNPDVEGTVGNFLQDIFNVFKYAAPLLCLVLSIADFVKAASSQDKDALMKAMKTTGKRIILAMILFFLPFLINFVFELLGWYGTCGIE